MPRVYNKYGKEAIPAGAIYVGRPSIWGNPYKMYGKMDRNRVCDLFERNVLSQRWYREKVKTELRGKDLVCYCTPKRCHADALLRIANENLVVKLD